MQKAELEKIQGGELLFTGMKGYIARILRGEKQFSVIFNTELQLPEAWGILRPLLPTPTLLDEALFHSSEINKSVIMQSHEADYKLTDSWRELRNPLPDLPLEQISLADVNLSGSRFTWHQRHQDQQPLTKEFFNRKLIVKFETFNPDILTKALQTANHVICAAAPDIVELATPHLAQYSI